MASLKLYENKAGKSFPQVEYLGIEPLYYTEIEVFDFDKNGSLDLFINGFNAEDSVVTKLFLNKITTKNMKPSVPTGLRSERGSNFIKLMWSHASDTESCKESLTYNIKIGSTPGANDILNSYVSEKGNLLLYNHFSTTDTM
ncbi:MAG: hypothetical protein IPO21_20265, partial [Bacteroidales bacterium]|nr:hypothetical protein [Bacteroidales bacterium]